MPASRREFVQSTLALAGAWALPRSVGAEAPLPAAPNPKSASPIKPLKVLILGGTAFLGPEIVEAARAHGHVLTLFNRGKTNPGLFPDIEKLRGDRNGDLKALEGRSWDAVIDTSGYVPRHVRDSARLLSKAVGHYVFISTVSVYADFKAEGMDESAPVGTLPDPTVEQVTGETYGPLKALCEKAAEEAMPGHVANVRPGLIVGPGDPTDRFSYWPVRVAKGGDVLAPGNPDTAVQFIDVRDLAAWSVKLVEDGHAGVYNAVGPKARLTMQELLHGGAGADNAPDRGQGPGVRGQGRAALALPAFRRLVPVPFFLDPRPLTPDPCAQLAL